MVGGIAKDKGCIRKIFYLIFPLKHVVCPYKWGEGGGIRKIFFLICP